MSAEEAKAAHESGLHEMGDSAAGEEQACYYLGPQRGNYDVGYMVVDGSVQRVDIRAPGVATAQGLEVGMPATAAEGLYQEIERQPNKYTDRDNLIIQLQGVLLGRLLLWGSTSLLCCRCLFLVSCDSWWGVATAMLP